MGLAITKYGWSDGKKQVSVYIELDGLDDLAEDAFTTTSDETSVSLAFVLDGKKRTFSLAGLNAEITNVKLQQKKGKNTVVLKLVKKEEEAWYKLLGGSSGGKDDDDDAEGGMPGGMGGMDMEAMMAQMGG